MNRVIYLRLFSRNRAAGTCRPCARPCGVRRRYRPRQRRSPAFPGNFGSLADARAFCETFFAYYNHEHRHHGIGLHTPASVHYGTATEVREQRRATLHAAYNKHPERFRHRRPEPPALPAAAWINQPSREALIQSN